MKVGDLVKMKDMRYHNDIGVIIKVIGSWRFKVHWADGHVLWEKDVLIEPVKKCP